MNSTIIDFLHCCSVFNDFSNNVKLYRNAAACNDFTLTYKCTLCHEKHLLSFTITDSTFKNVKTIDKLKIDNYMKVIRNSKIKINTDVKTIYTLPELEISVKNRSVTSLCYFNSISPYRQQELNLSDDTVTNFKPISAVTYFNEQV